MGRLGSVFLERLNSREAISNLADMELLCQPTRHVALARCCGLCGRLPPRGCQTRASIRLLFTAGIRTERTQNLRRRKGMQRVSVYQGIAGASGIGFQSNTAVVTVWQRYFGATTIVTRVYLRSMVSASSRKGALGRDEHALVQSGRAAFSSMPRELTSALHVPRLHGTFRLGNAAQDCLLPVVTTPSSRRGAQMSTESVSSQSC